MFELYLKDSAVFLDRGKQASRVADFEDACRYYRASVFCAYSALEAFVYYIASSFDQTNTVEKHEIAFINDRRVLFDPTVGLKEKSEYHSLEDKIRVLLRLFAHEVNMGMGSWQRLHVFKEFRDSLVHPKQIEDVTNEAEYLQNASDGLQSVIDIMNLLSLSIYQRPIRPKLLDLRPD